MTLPSAGKGYWLTSMDLVRAEYHVQNITLSVKVFLDHNKIGYQLQMWGESK